VLIRIIFLLLIFSVSHNVFSQNKPVKRDSLPSRRRIVQSSADDVSAGPAKRTHSKIVNDSAKAIYGPKTTLSSTEQNIFEGKKHYEQLDTAILNLHRWDFVRKYENKYQDLGNVGTALNPVFPLISSTIGATPGYKVYDLYYETTEPRFYDTKSPFSRINIIWGGRGRSMTHVEFTRNINPRWNFGINYRPVLSANQIPFSGNRNYQVISQYYDFNTSIRSKNSRYQLLASYRRIRHHAKENGGVKFTSDTTYKAYFSANPIPYFTISTNATATLSNDELRNNFHLFHHFQLARPAQLYHVLDISRQVNTFHNTKDAESAAFFKYATSDTTVVNDVNKFQVFQNEVGLKGNAAFLFYDFYYKIRSYTNTMANLQGQAPNASGIENYIGTRIAFRFDSLSQLAGQAEYLLDGHYNIQGTLRTPWLDAELHSALAKPGFMQQVYRGGYNTWNHNFTNTFSNQISGRIKAQVGPLFISPGFSYTALQNYIYFKSDAVQQALPVQSNGHQQILSPEVRMDIAILKKIHLKPQIIYTTVFDNDNDHHAISIPTWFSNVQLSYESFLFKGALQVQTGVELHAKSDYKALGYAPAIQQYYIQNSFVSPSFWTTDLFLNGRIKRGRFFVKYINLLQQFTAQGYVPTPGYPNVRSTIDFGFELILFD
jgi:hypothetical protein